jgi:hypothetical protein
MSEIETQAIRQQCGLRLNYCLARWSDISLSTRCIWSKEIHSQIQRKEPEVWQNKDHAMGMKAIRKEKEKFHQKGHRNELLGVCIQSSVWADHIAKIFMCLCICWIHTAVKWMSSNFLVWRRRWSAMCLGRPVDYWCGTWANKMLFC